jgi:hypothetical protein
MTKSKTRLDAEIAAVLRGGEGNFGALIDRIDDGSFKR